MDANQAMIDGGGFTVSEVSFKLACMRVLGTCANSLQRQELARLRRVGRDGKPLRAGVMQLSIGDSKVVTTRAEGAGPVDALTKAMRSELEKWYPAIAHMRLGTFTVTAIDVSKRRTRRRTSASP
jgi:2-isopropylmalate synthase